ncbi:MAG: hypothetical protein OM95_03815 [Bdellovibrio sp. ArHS]|uniref:hypothetical protein n=1 Tax=Bdellovibrio sp. ArHS TaxID=1569284 RepID=UPI000582EA4F|nr:hypothetical protein [Bdellovibrio sp. ArHS]KHD89490.1 MAG: hypothetical protein OM95_03815 [Bdellovibrio sp. ArHS]
MRPLLALFVVSFIALSVSATTLQDSVQKLQNFSAKDFEGAKDDEAVAAKTQEMLKTVEQTVEAALNGKEKISNDALKELARVSALTFAHDPSEAASEILLPLYKKEKKAFEKALRSLPKQDAKDLKESLRNAAREEDEGNG